MSSFFSIILPTFNRSKFICDTINSVLLQSYRDFEIIIVDDGSTDDTYEYLKKYTDERIIYIFQENQERSAARNHGISKANGQWLFFIDSDDIMVPDFLLQCHKQIQNNNFKKQLYITSFSYCDNETNNDAQSFSTNMQENENIIKYIFNNAKVISVSQVVTPIEFFCNHKFILKFNLWEDTHLFLRLLALYPYQIIDVVSIHIRKHQTSSIVKNMHYLEQSNINKHIDAINDLYINHIRLFEKFNVTQKDFNSYISKKLQMYLYQARLNKQFLIGCYTIVLGLKYNFSFKWIIHFLKLIISFLLYKKQL